VELISVLDNPLTEEYLSLKQYSLGKEISWFYHETTGSVFTQEEKERDIPLWGHHVMVRPNRLVDRPYTTITSNLFESAYKVISQIFSSNDIEAHVIYRLNINMTCGGDNKTTPWHKDLEFPHTNMIVYLNKFSDGWTYVRDGDVEEKHTPKEDGIIIFDGELEHCHAVTKPHERRIVMVVNYLRNNKE
jgi:hypothetical protein